MADKEERILILTTKNKNGDCECVTQDGCHINDSCAICNVGMIRQEAIEVMAKAMCHCPYPSCEDCIAEKKKEACKQAFEGVKELAEAALNALLEGVK